MMRSQVMQTLAGPTPTPAEVSVSSLRLAVRRRQAGTVTGGTSGCRYLDVRRLAPILQRHHLLLASHSSTQRWPQAVVMVVVEARLGRSPPTLLLQPVTTGEPHHVRVRHQLVVPHSM